MKENGTDPFQKPWLRDLNWLLTSPGILSGGGRGANCLDDDWCQRAFLETYDRLQLADQDPGLSCPSDRQPPFRLGRYAEDLVAWWLEQWPRCSKVRRGLQVRSGKRTIGEFDLLWYDRKQDVIRHWELAVKFYLRSQVGTDPALWIGPNPDDHLDRKLDILWKRQLRLAQTPAGKEIVVQHFGTRRKVRSQALVKGYLYYPSHEWPHCDPVPRGLTADHAMGWWCHQRDIDSLPADHRESRWLDLEKSAWLAPVIQPRDGTKLATRNEIIDQVRRHFRSHLHAVQLVELRPGLDGHWHERSRGFIVHDQWPATVVVPR